MSTAVTPSFYIRWLIKRDMPEVMAIENEVFTSPWPEEAFIELLSKRDVVGMVIERGDKVVGYMLYRLAKTKLKILNLVVAKDWQRQGVGSRLVDKLKSKLHKERTAVCATVCEDNLPVLKFLRANGFLAKKLLPGEYETLDGIYMSFSLN